MERSIELGFLGGANDKEPACQCRRRKRPGLILGWEDSLEESTPTRPSILAWRIPWTEEPRGATAHRAAKSQTRPRRLSAHIHRASAASRLSGHPQGQRGFSARWGWRHSPTCIPFFLLLSYPRLSALLALTLRTILKYLPGCLRMHSQV